MARGCLILLLASLSAAAGADTLVDPTQPLTGATSTAGAGQQRQSLPALQGIVMSSSGRSAMLNGQSVRVGQSVAGYRVLAIHTGNVILERDGQRHSLSLYSDKVRIQ